MAILFIQKLWNLLHGFFLLPGKASAPALRYLGKCLVLLFSISVSSLNRKEIPEHDDYSRSGYECNKKTVFVRRIGILFSVLTDVLT